MAIRPIRNRLPLLLLALWFAAPPVAAGALPDAQPLLDAALSAPDRPYQGHLTVTQWSGRQTHAEEVEVYYSPTNRYRWEFLAPDGSVTRSIVSDGANETTWLAHPGKAVTGEAVRTATKLMMPERERELLLKNYRLSVTGPDSVAGRKAWVLVLRPLVAGKPHQLLWIDTETQIILSIKRFLPGMQFATIARFTHFKLNPSLSDVTFKLSIDSSVPVTGDMTPDFLSIDELEKTTGRETDLPDMLPGGFAFESADYFEVGKEMVRHLRFTHGLAVLSIFLTDKPVNLPRGGMSRPAPPLSPPGALRLASTGKVYAFQHDRQYYTLMSDVSRDLLEHIAARMIPQKKASRQPRPAVTAAPVDPAGRIRWTKMAGSVESVELTANRLWAKTKMGKSRDFIVTEASKIIRDKKLAKLADIKPGDKVRLLRYNSATREIKKIELAPAVSHWAKR